MTTWKDGLTIVKGENSNQKICPLGQMDKASAF